MRKLFVLILLALFLTGCGKQETIYTITSTEMEEEGAPIPEEWRRDVAESEVGDTTYESTTVEDIPESVTEEVDSISMLGVTFKIPEGYTATMQREYDVLLETEDSCDIQIQLNPYVDNTARNDVWDEWVFYDSIVSDLGSKNKYAAEYYHKYNDWQLLFLVRARSDDESCKYIVEYIIDNAEGECDFTPIADLQLSEYGTLTY